MPIAEEESVKNEDSKKKAIDEDDSDDEDEQVYFTLYTADSYTKQLDNERKAKEKAEANLRNQGEAHLVDGELRFESEEDHGPAHKRNPDLIEGNTLPEDCGMPKALHGRPLEEIDKLITDKTFVVVAPRFKREYIYRFSSTPSFFCFTPWNLLRRATIYIATNQFFDYFIILTILTNCIFLAMPDEPAANTAEYVFLAIYTLEMIIKLIARGFFIYSYTYLRDAWNWLDFIVIISAYVTIVLEETLDGSSGLGNLQGIRTFRVFRVLRTVSIVPGLKTIVNALLRAFRLLLEVMMLILFCLMVFALFGLQIFMGVLRQKCVLNVPAYNSTPSYSYLQYYNDFIKNSSNWVEDEDDYLVCGNVSFTRSCPSGYTCLKDIGENPRFGYVGFDHFGWSMLTSFQLITLDFWEDTYNKILSTVGPWTVIFFVFVVFFGSFYLVNLMLAVVAMSYEEEAESAGKRRARLAKRSNTQPPPPPPPKPDLANTKQTSSEKEKEDKQKKKKKKKRQKEERDALKDLANTTTAAVAAAAEHALHPQKYRHHDDDDKKEEGPITALGTPTRKHIQRKPMVKMPSKDSGTGNSVESSRSNGSKEEDYLIHGDEASFGSSMLDKGFKKDVKPMPFRKPLLKQDSSGMVSSSGVTLTQHKGSLENIVDHDQDNSYDYIKEIDSGVGNKSGHGNMTTDVGRNYIADKYPELTIIDVEDNYDQAPKEGELINRNCNCCYNCCKGRLFVPWLKVQSVFFRIASEPLFDLFITVCILLNTVIMATEHHGMSEELKQVQRISNYIFTAVFTLEAVIKITAFGKHYFKIGWNIFDLIIVIASLIDLGLEDIQGLSVFRTFRLLRVFKLAQSWPTMRLLLSIIVNTLGALGNLTLILCIIIYIFAVIGLQLFNDKYTADKFAPDPVPRWHFKDIFHSFMMVFRILCGEWIEALWDCMRAADELCMAVFLPTLILGNFIVLNLFLALLLNAFASDSLRKAKEDSEDNKLKLAFRRIYDLCCCCLKKKNATVNSVVPNEEGEEMSMNEMGNKNDNTTLVTSISNGTHGNKQPNGTIKSAEGDDPKNVDKAFSTSTKREQYANFNKSMAANKSNNAKVGPAPIEETEDTLTPGVRIVRIPSKTKAKPKNGAKESEAVAKATKKDEDDLELGDEASTIKKEGENEEEEDADTKIEVVDCFPLCCTTRCQWICLREDTAIMQKWFAMRVMMNRIVEHKVFEGIILFLIAVSSISLAFEDVHLYSNQPLKDALFWLNIIFVTLFTVEMLMKWLAFGFKKYFTSFWTLLDFAIVVVSIASIIADANGAGNFSAFRALRTLRAFRPLRAISRWQGMKIVVNALMMAIPAIINVLLVCVVFWLIFSIMGVQFFAGKFYKCVDSDGETLERSVVKTKAECLANNYTWKNSQVTFDNVGAGYLALFQVATFEGWMEVMVDAIDSTAVDEQPSYENNVYYYLYFVGFIIFGSFFTLNLFIGVIIDNFNVLKKKYDGSYLDMFLTSGQRQYYNTLKKLGNKKPRKTIKRPKNKIQGVLYDVAVSTKFELCIVVTILLNMITMAIEHYNQTDTVTDVLKILNVLFTVIFSLEAVVKIIGLRLHYFRIGWNVFDFIVVILSLLEIILEDILADIMLNPTLFRVIRVFRIGRVLRLIKAAKGIRKLLFALVISLPALFNIGLLLFLIMYIYTIICLSSFQNLKISGALDDDVVNFKTFVNSFMLLFRLSTSAGWNDILEPMLIQAPDCNNNCYIRTDGSEFCDGTGDCGTPWLAVLALTTYILVIFLVVINMFIAVILENFNQAHEQEEVGITEDDFDMFYAVWERYDPLATQFIKYEQLSPFVSDLEPPLGIPKPNEIALVSFDLPIVEGDKLHCLDVLMALVKYVLGNVEETPEFKQLHEQMELRFQAAFPTRVNTTRKGTTMTRKKEDVAAKTLQRAWRSWKAQKQLKNITALAMQQSQSKKSTVEVRGKTSSIRSLGQRLSAALSQFFSSSRPSSAISRLSVRSTTPSTSGLEKKSTKTNKTGQVKSSKSLEVPQVSILYSPDKDGDIEL